MNILIKCSIDGKLEVRGNAEAFNGAYRDIVAGINTTLDAVIAPINEGAAVLIKIAHSDLSDRIKGDYKGYYNADQKNYK